MSARRGDAGVAGAFTWTHDAGHDAIELVDTARTDAREASTATRDDVTVHLSDGRVESGADMARADREGVRRHDSRRRPRARGFARRPRPDAPLQRRARCARDASRCCARTAGKSSTRTRTTPRSAVSRHAVATPAPSRSKCASSSIAGNDAAHRGGCCTVAAPAKLNLFLHVTGRRADGYHTLESLFVLIDLADTIELADARRRRRSCACADVAGVSERDDLVAARRARAARGGGTRARRIDPRHEAHPAGRRARRRQLRCRERSARIEPAVVAWPVARGADAHRRSSWRRRSVLSRRAARRSRAASATCCADVGARRTGSRSRCRACTSSTRADFRVAPN